MPNLTVIENTPEPITLKNYDQRALAFAQKTKADSYPTIMPGTPECEAWERYFDRHLSGRPWVFKALMSGQIKEMTVPAKWPEWFDNSYAA